MMKSIYLILFISILKNTFADFNVSSTIFYNLDNTVQTRVLPTEGGLLIDEIYFNYTSNAQKNVASSMSGLCSEHITSIDKHLYCTRPNSNSQFVKVVPVNDTENNVQMVENKSISTDQYLWTEHSLAFTSEYAVSSISQEEGDMYLATMNLVNETYKRIQLNTTKDYTLPDHNKPVVGISNQYIAYMTYKNQSSYKFWAFDLKKDKNIYLGRSDSDEFVSSDSNVMILNNGKTILFHQQSTDDPKEPASSIFYTFQKDKDGDFEKKITKFDNNVRIFRAINSSHFTYTYTKNTNNTVQVLGVYTVNSEGEVMSTAHLEVPGTKFKFDLHDYKGHYDFASDELMLTFDIEFFELRVLSDISKDYVIPAYNMSNGVSVYSTTLGLILVNGTKFMRNHFFESASYSYYYDPSTKSVWYANLNNTQEDPTCILTRVNLNTSEISTLRQEECGCSTQEEKLIKLESIQFLEDDEDQENPNFIYSCINGQNKRIMTIINDTQTDLYTTRIKDIVFPNYDDMTMIVISRVGNPVYELTKVNLKSGARISMKRMSNARSIKKIDDSTYISAEFVPGQKTTTVKVVDVFNHDELFSKKVQLKAVSHIIPAINLEKDSKMNGFFIIGGDNQAIYYYSQNGSQILIDTNFKRYPTYTSIIDQSLLVLREQEAVNIGTLYNLNDQVASSYLVSFSAIMGVIVAILMIFG